MLFFIETLGCKVNTYESNFMKETLMLKGYTYTSDASIANLIILNTCTVTNSADSKCLKVARRLRRENETAKLVICGCGVQNDKSKYEEINADVLIGNNGKSKIIDILNNKEILPVSISDTFEDMYITTFEQVRAYIKIQDGCENYCSFCIIPFVRGKKCSKDYDTIIKEVTSLSNNGFKEIVLTGIHTGSYNNNSKNIVDLIKDLSSIKGIKRIRISSIEITELKEDFFKLLATNKVICDNLHIPLQSGSNNILKRMNRKYDLSYYENVINRLREIKPNMYISTDIIVGHPYEVDEDFIDTYDFAKKMKFAKIHVFPYSDRNGTLSSKMDMHVDSTTKKERSKKLIELSNNLEREFSLSNIGLTKEVLIEEVKKDYLVARTSNFVKVKINSNDKLNDMIKIKLTEENILI